MTLLHRSEVSVESLTPKAVKIEKKFRCSRGRNGGLSLTSTDSVMFSQRMVSACVTSVLVQENAGNHHYGTDSG